jgi:hypothetical protein
MTKKKEGASAKAQTKSILVPPLEYVSLTQKKLKALLIFTATPRKIYDFPNLLICLFGSKLLLIFMNPTHVTGINNKK